jgi:hypothetical protein
MSEDVVPASFPARRMRLGKGLGGTKVVDPPAPVRPGRPRPWTFHVKHRAVPGLVVDVECWHLVGGDFAVVSNSGWLPDELWLAEHRQGHEDLVAAVRRAEAKLKQVREESVDERRRRVDAIVSGESRPRPNEDAEIAKAEDEVLAAQVRLVRYADQTLGFIREHHAEWTAALKERDRKAEAEVAAARAALAAALDAADATFAIGQWLAGSSGTRQVPSWSSTKNVTPKRPPDAEFQRIARAMKGWPADMQGVA